MMNSSRAPAPALLNVPAPQGSKPMPSYSRIIPAEELSGFSAWQPQALSGGRAPTEHPLRAQLAQQQLAPQTALDIDPQQAIAAARKAGYEEGYRDGMKALADFKKSHAKAMEAKAATQLAQWLTQLDAQWAELEPRMATSLAQTAVHLARQVLRQELQANPELVVGLAKEAVQAISHGARRLEVHVHPDDAALVEAGLGELLQTRGGRVVADPGLTRGGCRIQADIAEVDASLERRWAEAASSLGSRLAWDDEPRDDPSETPASATAESTAFESEGDSESAQEREA
jgi:flagellar assembly protein FliH